MKQYSELWYCNSNPVREDTSVDSHELNSITIEELNDGLS